MEFNSCGIEIVLKLILKSKAGLTLALASDNLTIHGPIPVSTPF